MATEKTDVVIVGVGAAGGILAAELGKAGMKVIGLERGPRLKTEDFNPHDELRYFQRQDLRPNVQRQPITWRPNGNARATPIPVQNYGNQAGGGTVHYGALSWRMHEDDFRARSHTVERYGAAAIPEDSSLADWPLSYADLEPHYDRAEYELGVSGKAGNLQGKKIDGGNVFEAPRRRDYPLPPLLAEQSEHHFRCRNPQARLSPVLEPAGDHLASIQRAAGLHLLWLLPGLRMPRRSQVVDPRHQAARGRRHRQLQAHHRRHGLPGEQRQQWPRDRRVVLRADGSDNTIEAELVILAPFIYDNTRLLLLSKTEKFPNGLANSSGHVGKHLTGHMMANVFVGFDDRHLNVYMGPSAQKHTLDDFNADNFDHSGLGFIRGAQISIGTGNLEGGPISLTTVATPPNVPRWGAAYRDFLAKYFTRHAAMVAQTENLPYADQTIDLDPNVRDAWGLPAPRLTYDWRRPNERARVEFMQKKMEEIGRAMGASLVWRAPVSPAGAPGAHHEGGTRMGNDPKTSVVNRYGQSWDVPNLFVVGSSTFPSMSGFNPTLTIQALAYMSADAIVNRYKKSPGPLL